MKKMILQFAYWPQPRPVSGHFIRTGLVHLFYRKADPNGPFAFDCAEKNPAIFLSRLFLSPHREFHELPRSLRSNLYFAKFRPLALFIDSQHGAGLNFS